MNHKLAGSIRSNTIILLQLPIQLQEHHRVRVSVRANFNVDFLFANFEQSLRRASNNWFYVTNKQPFRQLSPSLFPFLSLQSSVLAVSNKIKRVLKENRNRIFIVTFD